MKLANLVETKCDRCLRKFYRKRGKNGKPALINEISYWTEGKEFDEYKIICRGCLKEWWIRNRKSFIILVPQRKKNIYHQYFSDGLIDESREIYAEDKYTW